MAWRYRENMAAPEGRNIEKRQLAAMLAKHRRNGET